MPYMSDGPAELYISALRRARERGRQDARLRLARADETVEVFRDNKVQLRMQLLTGTLQERRCILRAAIMVCPSSEPSLAFRIVTAMCSGPDQGMLCMMRSTSAAMIRA